MPSRGEIGAIKVVGTVDGGALYVDWSIRDYSLLSRGLYDCYDSPEFRFSDGRWHLTVWPNWRNKTEHPVSVRMRLGLTRSYEGPPKIFHVTGGINKFREEEMDERESPNISVWYVETFCMRSAVTNANDILTVKCVIKYAGPGDARGVSAFRDVSIQTDSEIREFVVPANGRQSLDDKQAVDELQSSLQSLLKSEEDCDVAIKVRGKEFRAHRLILRRRSPVFQAMFSHDMVEKQKGVVTMEDCDQDTFPAFLEHIYTGSLGVISAGNVFGLYASSKKYDLKTLKKACAEFMKKNLTVSSFCDAITLAVKHDDKELIEHATDFFCKNTLDIVKTAEWQIFLAENPTVGNELYIKQLMK